MAFGFREFLLGAIVYQLAFLLDCMDGKVASIRGLKTSWGGFFDVAGDTARFVSCFSVLALVTLAGHGDTLRLLPVVLYPCARFGLLAMAESRPSSVSRGAIEVCSALAARAQGRAATRHQARHDRGRRADRAHGGTDPARDPDLLRHRRGSPSGPRCRGVRRGPARAPPSRDPSHCQRPLAMTTVLYMNHTSKVSGAERTLLDLLRALPDDVRPVVTSPEGRLADEVRALGVEHLTLRECNLSLKLDLRATPQAMLRLVRAGGEAVGLARRTGARFVHAFSVRSALGCGLGSNVPMVAHAHDALGRGAPSRAVAEVLSRRSRVILAASSYVADRLPRGRHRAPVSVVDNPVDLERFDPTRLRGEAVRAELGIPPTASVLAVVGQITPWKGQDVAVKTLAAIRQRGIDAHLLLVGAAVFTDAMTRHDNLAYYASLEALRESLSLEDKVHFLGEREDVPAVLAATDLTLVPSWKSRSDASSWSRWRWGCRCLPLTREAPPTSCATAAV